MKICSIEHCNREHEARGYCKNHYNSFLKYDDALFVENLKKQRALDKAEELRIKEQKRADKQSQRVCMVDNCGNEIYARFLCVTHYRFMKGLDTKKSKTKRNVIKSDTCLVLGCDRVHVRHGFCKSHLTTINQIKSPYRAKVVKYCGVKGCDEKHFGNGLCQKHYGQWNRIVEKYNLHEFVELTE